LLEANAHDTNTRTHPCWQVAAILTFLLFLGAAAAMLGHYPAWVAITLLGSAVVLTGCSLVV
jgi:hypothetical protein